MTLFTFFTIPNSTTALEFIGAMIVELLLFSTLIGFAIASFSRYTKKPLLVRLYVALIFSTYLLVIGGMAIPKFLYFIDLSPLSIISQGDRIAEIGMLLNTMILWLFIIDVFVDQNIKKLRLIVPLIIGLGGIILFRITNLIAYEPVAAIILLSGLMQYLFMVKKAKEVAKKLPEILDQARMVTLGRAGEIMIMSYILSIFTGVTINLGLMNTYHPIRSISAIIGIIAMIMIFIAFFPPSSYLLRFVKTRKSPLDNGMYPTKFIDDLPQLTSAEAGSNNHCVEWWYFDWEDTQSHTKVVCIFKRCDTTTYPGFGAVHLELTLPDHHEYKLYRKTRFEEYKMVLDPPQSENEKIKSVTIEVCSKNSFTLMQASNGEIERILLHAEIGDAFIELDAKPLAGGVKIGSNGHYYESKVDPKVWMGAMLSAPYFVGNSNVVYKNDSVKMNAIGYHDHTFGTADLLDTNRHWYWARAYLQTPKGQMYMMYGDVEPQKLFYGRMKYMVVVPHEGATPLTDIDFQIQASDYRKHTKLKFPRHLTVTSAKLGLTFDLTFKENHFDQAVYNRSVFNLKMQSTQFPTPIDSQAFVEYYNMPEILTFLIRPMVKLQYNGWLVDK